MRQQLLWALGLAIILACQPTDSTSPLGTDTTDTPITRPIPPPVCGDAVCDATNEDTTNCPGDCGSWCGDGVCNGPESTVLCPQDCGNAGTPHASCGDGVCSQNEDTVSCSLDCGSAPDALVFNIIIRQTYQSCSSCGIWFDWQGEQANKPRLVVEYEHVGALHTAEYQHDLGGMDNAHSIWIQSGHAHDEGNKHQMLIKQSPHRKGLLRVDASDIPAAATITEARLHLHINKHEGLANADHSSILMVHESARDWDWNSVSWTHAATGQPWTTEGGDLGREVREIHAGGDMHDLGFNKAHPDGFFDFTPYMQLLQSERGLGSGTVCGDGLCAGPETQAICPQDCGAPPDPDNCGDGSCNGDENAGTCPQDCSQSFPPPSTVVNANIHGFIDSVNADNGGAVIQGWACHLGQVAAIEVHAFAGGDVASGTFLKSTLANVSNEQAVNDACQAGGSHRYQLSLSPSEVKAHAGKSITVYGVAAQGSAPLANSDKFHLPVGAPPINSDVPFDLNTVKWLHVNVTNWPVTANLSSVSVQGGTICMEYDKKSSWPSVAIPHNSGNGTVDVVANPWVFIEHDGQWYAATWEWMGVGSTCKNKTSVAGDHIKQPPFGPMDWKPTSGQTLYFMVSGLARFSNIKNVSERSNIVKVIWP
jgi:hypothetical protein